MLYLYFIDGKIKKYSFKTSSLTKKSRFDNLIIALALVGVEC